MGVLIDGKWRDEELPQETGAPANSAAATAASAKWSPPMVVRVQGRGRSLSPLRRLWLPLGAPHPDLSRGQEARGRDHRRLCAPRHQGTGLDLRENPGVPDCPPDTVKRFHYLHEAYTASEPTTPARSRCQPGDNPTRRVVNNESSEIIRMLNASSNPSPATTPISIPRSCAPRSTASTSSLQPSITASIAAASRARKRPTRPPRALFETLDEIEARLGRQRYLVGRPNHRGRRRLFPTLVRFDVAYFSLFKCNASASPITPTPELHARPLPRPRRGGDGEPRQYIANYWSIKRVNPTGIIPKGTPVDYAAPHDRARFAA